MFSSDGGTIFVCYNEMIQVWCLYLDDDNEDHLITLWKKAESGAKAFEFSRDNAMVVIHNGWTNTGILWSIDTDRMCLTKKFDFQGSAGLYFTPDGKYIFVSREIKNQTVWSIAEGKYTNNTIHFLDNGGNHKGFSPANRQCIVARSGNLCITLYVVN